MRHQPWDPFAANANEAAGSMMVEDEAADWQSDLLVLSAFIQGFSEQIAEVLSEAQASGPLPCEQSKP